MDLDDHQVDADRFEALAEQGRELIGSDPSRASALLREALALWRGRALDDFAYEAFAEDEIRRLEHLRLAAVEDRIDADLAQGLATELISELEGHVRRNPLNERLAGQLMTAFHRCGRQAEVERTYLDLTDRLGTELGVDPSTSVSTLRAALADDTVPAPVFINARGATSAGQGSTAVRGYELREPLNADAYAVRHRAFQPATGRDVILHRILAEHADDPNFIRHFETTAALIAAIDHPNLAPLHDFWREPGAAFLVTRFFPRGSLLDVLSEGPLAPGDVERFELQIGGAIGAMQEMGMGHGDLSTERIFLDDGGNFFLDGLAAGRLPANGNQHGGDEGAAFETLLAEVSGSSRHHGSASPSPHRRNPFKGLRAFDRSDANDFHGRERLVERLVRRADQPGMAGRFLVVVGASGSGKSSVVRAGLVPALQHGAVNGSEEWFVVEMTPKARPFEELADALASVADEPGWAILERLTERPNGLTETIDRLLPHHRSRLVLIIDQLEELYLQVDESDRSRFIEHLVDAILAPDGRLLVVACLRADFYDRPLAHGRFGELVRLGTEVITPMGTDELARSIVEPASSCSVTVEPTLLGRMLADINNQPAALPMLQFTLTEMFEGRAGDVLTADAYDEVGGVSGALVKRADRLLEVLGPEGEEVARQVLLRLVTVGGDASEDTRRRVLIEELEALGSRRTVATVLEAFGRHRLFTFDRDPTSRSPTVEIAHEALLREWRWLRSLLEENREGIRQLRALSVAADQWERTGRDPSELYRGSKLDLAADRVNRSGARLRPVEREFISAGERTRLQQLDLERERHVQQRHQNRRLRRLLVAVAGVAAVAMVLGALAMSERSRATAAHSEGETRRLATDSSNLVSSNRRLALLMAAEAYRREVNPNTIGALQRVLIGTEGLLGHLGSGRSYVSARFTGDGSTIVGVRQDGLDLFDLDSMTEMARFEVPETGPAAESRSGLVAITSAFRRIRLFDVNTRRELASLDHTEEVRSLGLSPDGGTLAIGDAAGLLRLVDMASGSDLIPPIPAHTEDDFDPSLLPDDAQLSGAHEPAGFPLGVRSVDFTADGRTVATAGGTFIRTWSAVTGELLHEVAVVRPSTVRADVIQAGRPTDVDIRDGGSTAIVRTNRFIQVWDLETGTRVDRPVILSDAAAAVADNGFVAMSLGREMGLMAELNLVAQIDLLTGDTVRTFDLQSAATRANIDLSDDERVMVSGGADGIVVWALDGGGLISRPITSTGLNQTSVRTSPDGRFLALNHENAANFSYSLWDTGAQQVRRLPLSAQDGRMSFALDGHILVQDGEGMIDVRRLDDPSRAIAELGILNNYSTVDAPDGTLFVIGTGVPDRALIHLFDSRALTKIGPPISALDELGASAVVSASFSPDGSRLAAATSEGIAAVFDTETWEMIGVPIGSGAGQVISVEFSPDGRFLATGDGTGRITIRDPTTLQPNGAPLIGSNSGVAFASSRPLAFTPDGSALLSTIDGVGRMWDMASRTQIGTPIRTDAGTTTSPSRRGDLLPAVHDGQVVVYDLTIESWFDIACSAAGRNFTEQEWAQFGPEDSQRRPTCPHWDLD